MSAAALLREFEGHGVELTVAGDTLRWRAPPGAMTAEMMVTLKARKSEVIEVLVQGGTDSEVLIHAESPAVPVGATDVGHRAEKRPTHQWDATDWKAFYDERAAIAEFDGGQSRQQAEALAFETTVVEWMNVTPPADVSEDRCAGCGKPLGEIGSDAVPVLAGGGAHAWVHHGACHKRFRATREAAAVKALATMGISAPDGSHV